MKYFGTIDSTIKKLKQVSDINRQMMASTNHPSSMEIIGVKQPILKQILKTLRDDIKSWDINEKIELCIEFAKQGILECQLIAYEFVNKDKSLRNSLSEKEILDLKTTMDNWVSVDSYSVYISGYAWREGVLSENTILKWAESDDVWERRISIVSTIPFNQKAHGGTGDSKKTLMICKKHVHDKHPMITKAMSWALRVLSGFERDAVADFVNLNKNDLHALIVREVNSKLTTGKKN